MKAATYSAQIKILVLSCFIFVAFPIILTLLIPIFVCRYFVGVMKQIFRRDLGELIEARSTIFAVDDFFGKPCNTNGAGIVLGGHLSVEELRNHFRERISEAKHGSTKLFPELEQYPAKWMGFFFWKPEKNFRLDEHIKEYDGPIEFERLNEETASEILLELLKRPFLPGKSPWELYTMPNYEIDGDPTPHISKTLFIIRIHHCLTDGYSAMRLIETLAGYKYEGVKPNYVQRHWVASALYILSFIFRVPYDLASTLVLNCDPISPWHLPEGKLSRDKLFARSPKIPLTYIKSIRDVHRATTTGVIIAATTGAMRRVMLASGKGIPENFTVVTAIPVPGHPEKLCNHMTSGIVSLPVDIEDPLERLRIIEKDMKGLRKSTMPATYFWFTKIFGSLFPEMINPIINLICQRLSSVLSNFPGPSKEIKFFDLPYLHHFFLGGFLAENIGMFIGSVSYAGKLSMSLGVDDAIFSKDRTHLKNFGPYLQNELDNLMHAKKEL